MTSLSLASTQTTIGAELVNSVHFHDYQTENLINTAKEIFQSVYTRGATFRHMRRAATRMNLEWTGTSCLNFVIYLPFSATTIPLYSNPDVTAEETNIQKAFAQCFAEIKANHANIHTNAVFMNGHIAIRSNDDYYYACGAIDAVANAMWKVTKMVKFAVIQKKGWFRYDL